MLKEIAVSALISPLRKRFKILESMDIIPSFAEE
jgi:hypothetical protein